MSNPAVGAASVFRGTIRVGEDRCEYSTSFSSGLRLQCLPGCGLCCKTYRIPLTAADLDHLRKVVEPEACSNIAFDHGAQVGGIAAFMENGKARGCCYLDDELRCSVYGSRPLYCRTYPLIRDSYAQLEMSVDHTCPGVGSGDPITNEQIEETLLLEGENRPGSLNLGESSANHEIICSSLRAMGVYAEAELMRSVSAELIGRGLTSRRGFQILSYLESAAAALARQLSGSGNLMNPEEAARLVEGVQDILDRNPGETTGSELSEGAAHALADYLKEWTRRQALLRFVHSMAVAHARKVNVLLSFFEFLGHVVSTVLTSAEVLRKLKAEERVTARLMREAIQGNEGLLRRKCASVVSRY